MSIAHISATTLQKGASIARVSGDGGLLVVADVIEPDEHTSFSARRAADILCRSLARRPAPERAKQSLLDGFGAAHAALYDPDPRSSSIFALAGAVSAASLLLAGPYLILGTVGSCRCYLKRDQRLTCVDRGHSAAPSPLSDDEASGEERSNLAQEHRDLVTEAIGLREEIRPSLGLHEARTGDRFLICTSAVWSSIPEKLLSMAMSEADLDRARELFAHLIPAGTGGFAFAMAHVDDAPGGPTPDDPP